MTIQMVQAEVDGIEFYVSIDGTQSGMSISGLARLCGISRPSLQDLLQKIQLNEGAGKKAPETLKALSGKGLYMRTDADNNAQVIPADKDIPENLQLFIGKIFGSFEVVTP